MDYFAKGRKHCPSFNIQQEILVPNGVRREIAIEVSRMPTPQVTFYLFLSNFIDREILSEIDFMSGICSCRRASTAWLKSKVPKLSLMPK